MATYEEDSDVYMPDVFKPKKKMLSKNIKDMETNTTNYLSKISDS